MSDTERISSLEKNKVGWTIFVSALGLCFACIMLVYAKTESNENRIYSIKDELGNLSTNIGELNGRLAGFGIEIPKK